MLQSLTSRLHQWIFDPPNYLEHRPLLLLLKLLRYCYALLRDLLSGELNLRAMSLVYTTLLSLAPLLALAFSVLKGLGYDRDLEPVLYQFLEPLGSRASELTARIMSYVANVREGVLGSLGLAFLIYTVISTVQKVEESFNFVWQVEKPRSWARRFSEYLSVMVIGPVIIVAMKLLWGTLTHSGFVESLEHFSVPGWLIQQLRPLATFILVSLAFTFLYSFIPNTRVRFTAALCGGVFAGVLWTLAGALFTYFVASSAQTAMIYAGFAIVIVGLIWVYLSWVILLLGTQLAFYVQHPQSLRTGQREVQLTPALRERLALSVMYLVARDFAHGGPHHDLNALSQLLDVPARAALPVLATLEAHGLLLNTDDEKYLPGRDPANIKLRDILVVVRESNASTDLPRLRGLHVPDEVATAADAALRDSVQERTLAELLRQT